MVLPVKCFHVLVLFVIVNVAGFGSVDSAGECGKIPANRMAFRMAPCASASQDVNARVSGVRCSAVQQLGKNPGCLCAVMLSNTAKTAGVKPEVAITIPKRCNLADPLWVTSVGLMPCLKEKKLVMINPRRLLQCL